MKKQIGYSVVLLLCLFLTGEAYGQNMLSGSSAGSGMISWPHSTQAGHKALLPMPESADIPLSYYDPSLATHPWLAASNWGIIDIIAFTERITLPSDSGFLDSVRIVFDAIAGDSVSVGLDPDTVIATPVGIYHLDATVFSPTSNDFATAVIYPSKSGSSDTTVTVAFPHVPVPRNFHIVLVPSSSSVAFTSSYSVRGDSEVTHLRTTDNCHSTFIGINPSTDQSESGVIDSNLTPAGFTSPIYSELYITAFVSSQSSGVSGSSAARSISIFPDPASTFINIQGIDGPSTVELLDLLGRPVLSAQIDGEGKLDINRIQVGRYEAVIHTTNGLITMPLLIQR
jgi:hypothetical protein